jgi:hypothetical protein
LLNQAIVERSFITVGEYQPALQVAKAWSLCRRSLPRYDRYKSLSFNCLCLRFFSRVSCMLWRVYVFPGEHWIINFFYFQFYCNFAPFSFSKYLMYCLWSFDPELTSYSMWKFCYSFLFKETNLTLCQTKNILKYMKKQLTKPTI